MSVATVIIDDEKLGVFTQNCLGNLGFENRICEALCALAIKMVEHSGSPSKSIEEIRERLNVMKANIAGVNQDDLIPQVFLQDELSTLAEKKVVLNRFRDIPDSLVIARARNLVVSTLNPVKNMSEGVDRLNIPSSVAELYPSDVNMFIAEGEVSCGTLDIVAENLDKFRIVALATGSNVTLLVDQVKTFKPQLVVARNESLVDELKEALAVVEDRLEFIPSELRRFEGKDIALANKKTLIAGDPFVLPLVHKHKVKIPPADSEHFAIFQIGFR
ncbi:unnamed protein product [Camellia sinensis]